MVEYWKGDFGSINRKDLLDFLTGSLAEKELSGLQSHPNRQIISLAKELITVFLPAALSKKGDENFGLSLKTNKKYSIPFKANNTPDELSEHGNVYETMLYSAHIYAQNGLKQSHCDELLAETQRKIRLESKEKGVPFAKTEACQQFTSIYKIKNPFFVTEQEKTQLAASVTTDFNALSHWLSRFVYPEIRTYRRKISGNPFMLIDMLAHAQGFTGTPWNRRAAPPRLYKPEREKEISNAFSELEILHAIYQNVKDGGIDTLKTSAPQAMLDEILRDFSFDCLIDVGALLNGIINEEVAEKLRKMKNPRGIIFFNDQNELVVKLENIPQAILLENAEKDDRDITYYDQNHTTGADIRQKATAMAVLTFRDKTLRDMSQGAMRMRQLLTSNKIKIVLPGELGRQLAGRDGEVTFDSLMMYAIVQQSNQLVDQITRSVQASLHQILYHRIDVLIRKTHTFKDKMALEQHFKEVLTDNYSDDPYLEFGSSYSMEDALKVLEGYRQQKLSIIKRLMNKKTLEDAGFSLVLQEQILALGATAKSLLKAFVMPMKKELPAKMREENVAQLNKETNIAIEQKVDVEVEVISAMPRLISNRYQIWGAYANQQPSFDDPLLFTPNRSDPPKHGPLVVQVNKLLHLGSQKACHNFFDDNLCVTKLFYESIRKQSEPLLGAGTQKKCYQILFVVEPNGDSRVIMIDPVEASALKKYLPQDEVEGRKLRLIDLNSQFSINKGDDLTTQELEKLAFLQLQVKFFNGVLNYSKSEKKLLKVWLDQKGKHQAKKVFKTIIAAHPGLQQQYDKSWIKKNFRHQPV
jgi:hypothetical protein